jgi:hypothetical protein
VSVSASIERRLAIACCRGERQMGVVNELLAGPVMVRDRSLSPYPNGPWWTVGVTQCDWNSFKALKKRLVSVGFVFEELRDPKRPYYFKCEIKMTFPEGKE